jgi:hypothetical protein
MLTTAPIANTQITFLLLNHFVMAGCCLHNNRHEGVNAVGMNSPFLASIIRAHFRLTLQAGLSCPNMVLRIVITEPTNALRTLVLFSPALQPSAGYGLLVHEIS